MKCLSPLIVFNGKRGEETAQMKVKDYQKARECKKDLQGSIYNSLRDEEKSYAKGKCQTHNYVNLTEITKEAMDVLL